MGHGRIVFEGTPADLKNNEAIRKEWLEVWQRIHRQNWEEIV